MTDRLTFGERVRGELRELYPRYGYARYRMNGFEEYDLYASNRDFLQSGQIITFTSADGRLMALKPDVTMSIIKDARDETGRVDKFYYSENVYRVPSRGGDFREIVQTGLECIGDIGDYDRAEVIMLAAASLAAVSRDYVLDISHMGLVSGVLEAAGFGAERREAALDAVRSKNRGALVALCGEADCGERERAAVISLTDICGDFHAALPRLSVLNVSAAAEAAIGALNRLSDALRGIDGLRLDLSVVHDMNYYDGTVFAGYVAGIPETLLRGGEYGRLMKKMGRGGGAVGFAVYTDLLELLEVSGSGCVADILLLCGDSDSPAEVAAAVGKLTTAGKSVLVQRSDAGRERCRELVRLVGLEVR